MDDPRIVCLLDFTADVYTGLQIASDSPRRWSGRSGLTAGSTPGTLLSDGGTAQRPAARETLPPPPAPPRRRQTLRGGPEWAET